MTQYEFENKCMDLIEQIVGIIGPAGMRQKAIDMAKKMCDEADKKDNALLSMLYQRVYNEFQIASDEEYETLRAQIFQ